MKTQMHRTVLRVESCEDRNAPSSLTSGFNGFSDPLYSDPNSASQTPATTPTTSGTQVPSTQGTGDAPSSSQSSEPTPSEPPAPTPVPDPVPAPGSTDVGNWWGDFVSVVYNDGQIGGSSLDDAERINSGLADPVAAPTSTPVKMGQVADKLVTASGSKDAANNELLGRGVKIGDKVMAFDVDQLKSDALKDRYQLTQQKAATVGKDERMYFTAMWGQDISLPNYNGTVIQTFDIETKAWFVGEANPGILKETQVEAFFLKNGKTNMDLQTTRLDFPTAKITKVEKTIKVTLGAGTFKGLFDTEYKGVDKFTILDEKHKGAINGDVKWAGQTVEFTMKMTVDSKGATSYSGPWDVKK